MTDDVMSILLAVLEEAALAGTAPGASATSFYSRESANEKGLREGLIYDMTVNGLICSQFERVAGITDRGRSAYEGLQGIQAMDPSGLAAARLASAFIPSRPH